MFCWYFNSIAFLKGEFIENRNKFLYRDRFQLNWVVSPEQSEFSPSGWGRVGVNLNICQSSGSKWETEWKLSTFRVQSFPWIPIYQPQSSSLRWCSCPWTQNYPRSFSLHNIFLSLRMFWLHQLEKGIWACLLIPAFQPSVSHGACSLAFRNDRLHSE